ncbi:MAG: adenosylmethionine--8-amino-7-oxononanoate transaminase [Oxalobacteraceae bacterium]|jgi:adenosylmethionine-8-amino-7-oxononanoate aminotransferase|nr:adenosylmethionine--8-amino-7-oxononanoate transaminase [Oxalobacteraceae bacterium]
MNQIAHTDWVARSLASVWHPCTQMQHHETLPLMAISHGKGAWLYDYEGRRYLDAVSSWWVNLFGHANPRINAALNDQLEKLEHAMLAGFTHAPVVQLSERLAAKTNHALGHCFFASDGASAVEIALKMSFHAWRNAGHPQKQEFVCLTGSYHGETVGALGVTDVPLFTEAYGGMYRRAHVVASPAAYGELNALSQMRALLERRAGQIAAVIVEPLVQCAGGMAMYEASYLSQLRALCDQFSVHLIADEIAVGCGRTGSFFACEQAAIWPDFMCLSKGISGGYLPLSLVMTTDDIYQAFYHPDIGRAFLHSHSYTGNPLACRAALATLDIFDEDDVLLKNRERADKLGAALAAVAAHPNVSNARQTGMICAFDVTPEVTDGFSRRFFAAALQQGVLLRPIGTTVYWMPPYVVSDEEIALLGDATLAVLEKVAGSRPAPA